VQLAALVIVAVSPALRGHLSLAAAVLNLLTGPAVALLAHTEHVKSVRPSFLLSAYLFASSLLDAASARTEWLEGSSTAYASILTTAAAIKLVLLSLETVEKRRLLHYNEKGISTESTSGPFSRGLFVWLTGLLRTGFMSILTSDTLPSIYEKLASEKIHARFAGAWEKCTSNL